jgi:hypothetical protein
VAEGRAPGRVAAACEYQGRSSDLGERIVVDEGVEDALQVFG